MSSPGARSWRPSSRAGSGPAAVRALDWPVTDRIITGTFGEDRGDHFHHGIDLGGGDQEVHPVLPGELVFRYDEEDDYSSLPRGVGSFVVLHHEQDILSFYAHLQKGSLGPIRDRRYSPRTGSASSGTRTRGWNAPAFRRVRRGGRLHGSTRCPSFRRCRTPSRR